MICIQNVSSIAKRWLIFNAVGAMGIMVQMSMLMVLTTHAGLGYLPATALAVEAAILHNFFWHVHWTWSDRSRDGICSLLRWLIGFHLTNGLLSICGNLFFMRIFVENLRLEYLTANALAIVLCSILNFMAGDRLVFRNTEAFHKKER